MKEIRIIHTNDIHSSFDELLRLSSIIKANTKENTLLLDAGDFNDFSSLLTKGTYGKAGLDVLDYLEYEALTIGNNEGFQHIKTIEKMCASTKINVLSCNLFKEDNKTLKKVKPFVIKEVSGIKFLIIGVSPYKESYNEYFNCYGLKVVEPFEIIRRIIKENKGNYDFAILLSHLGLKTDIMMSQSINSIDIIVGGHSHHAINAVKVNNSIIHQSGVRGSHVGILDIQIENNKIVGFNDKNIEVSKDYGQDINALKILKDSEKIAFENLSKIVACAKENLSYSIEKECNFTNLLADYLYNKYPCDFVVLNSGVTEYNIAKGKVSKKEIALTCNSPLIVSSIYIKGKHLLKAIEESYDISKCFYGKRMIGFRGRFLGKLHTSFNCRINNKQLFINNLLLESQQYYKIVTVDLLSRGMGYRTLKRHKECKLLNETIQEVIVNAINDQKAYKNININRWED